MTVNGDKPPVTANKLTAKWETLKSWFATHKSQFEIQNSNPEIIANVISAGNGLVGSGLERVWVAPEASSWVAKWARGVADQSPLKA